MFAGLIDEDGGIAVFLPFDEEDEIKFDTVNKEISSSVRYYILNNSEYLEID
ncbi:MAG: hypothetical protein N2749_01075 [Clostridia bacterium]|nr:hypothetical protein [Clostridia bacterium]